MIKLINNGLSKISKDEIENILENWGGTYKTTKVPWTYIIIGLLFFLVVTVITLLWNIQLQKKVRYITRQISNQNSVLIEKKQKT